jgi:hypothetical protein
MDTALQYLAQRTRELYSAAVELQHLQLSGIQRLRQLERLRPQVFDVSHQLTDLFGEGPGQLERARAAKAQRLILALHRRLILGYWRLLRGHDTRGPTAALLMQRLVRSAQQIHFSCLFHRHEAPAGLWNLLHRTHQHACRMQVQHLKVDDGEAYESRNQTVAHGYLHALLLAGSRPLDIPPDCLPALIESAQVFTALVRIGPAQPESRRLLALGQDRPFRAPRAGTGGGYTLELDELLNTLARFTRSGSDASGFDLNAHLLACWSNTAQQTWEVCCGLPALLAQLGANDESGLDARHFQRQPQLDVWAQHSAVRGGLDELVPHHSDIEFASVIDSSAEPTIYPLNQVVPGSRSFSGIWAASPPPGSGEWLGVRKAPNTHWSLARTIGVETLASGATRLHGTCLSARPHLCRLTLRGKTRQSTAHHALLLGDGKAQCVLCPTLPLEAGRKVSVDQPGGTFLALLGEPVGGAFPISRLAVGPGMLLTQ